jgi:hypothetical protein
MITDVRQASLGGSDSGGSLDIIRIVAGALLILTLGGVEQGHNFVAAPNGDDNGECTDARPCSPQGAVKACPMGAICSIALKPGLYLDPEVNIYYHRTISFTGNCNDPNAIIFRTTKPSTALVWIQDHAIGTVSCLAMDSESTGTIGVSGRQHIIADYGRVIFGAMYDGIHVATTEFSIASCIDAVWITGDAAIHAAPSDHSKLNLGCSIKLSEPRAFIYFVRAAAFSIIDAQLARFGSSCRNWGIGCNSSNAIVYLPEQGFPGSQPGNC